MTEHKVNWKTINALIYNIKENLVVFRLTAPTLCIFILLIADAGSAQDESIGKWDIFEINLTTTNTYPNPYLDVWIYATFNGPNKTIKLDGFWDGSSNWKIRMAPTEVGEWNYITSSNDPQFDGRTGSFTVTESGMKGFVKVSSAYPHSFKYDDGTPFFFLGDTVWMSTDPVYVPFNGIYQNWVDVRKNQGFSLLQTNLQMTQGASEGGPAFPNYPDTTVINPGYYQWLDKRIEYATVQKGMVVEFSFMWAQNYFDFGETNYKNYMKYVMARYSAYNVFFSIIGEYEEVENVAVIRRLGQYSETLNPYNHPVTTHCDGTTADDYGNESWISHHTQTGKGFSLTQINSDIIRDSIYGKPVVQAEVCYETQIGEFNCIDPFEYRKAGWVSIIGSGYYIYGHNDLINVVTNWNILYSQGAKEMGYLRTFWDKIEFWKLSPSNYLVTSGFASVNIGKEYVIYLPTGGSTTVNLSAASGTLFVEWYNPRTGIYQDRTTVRGGASITFTAPDSNDWVLHINSISTTFFPYPFQYFDILLNPLKRFIYSG